MWWLIDSNLHLLGHSLVQEWKLNWTRNQFGQTELLMKLPLNQTEPELWTSGPVLNIRTKLLYEMVFRIVLNWFSEVVKLVQKLFLSTSLYSIHQLKVDKSYHNYFNRRTTLIIYLRFGILCLFKLWLVFIIMQFFYEAYIDGLNSWNVQIWNSVEGKSWEGRIILNTCAIPSFASPHEGSHLGPFDFTSLFLWYVNGLLLYSFP